MDKEKHVQQLEQILSQLQSEWKWQVLKQEPKSSRLEESFDGLQQNDDDY